jgi:hypothetical protein
MENIENLNSEEELKKIAIKRVKKIKNFYIHAFIYSIGLSIYILENLFRYVF